ncbi:MAG: hypothetical protein EOO90_09035 [Pedobacter sp.]|nr:MAG: hypothetical protein EOO90_09035 [Pedobacter sp.]
MKTVLIPTDFNVETIKIIDAFSLNYKLDGVKFIFLHSFKLSDSITDMLMLSRRSRDYENISDEFYAELEKRKQIHTSLIGGIAIEYFYGSTVAAFKNLLEDREVDAILYPKNYSFAPINKYSIDPNLLTSRCGCPVIELDLNVVNTENLFETKMHDVSAKAISA